MILQKINTEVDSLHKNTIYEQLGKYTQVFASYPCWSLLSIKVWYVFTNSVLYIIFSINSSKKNIWFTSWQWKIQKRIAASNTEKHT